MVDAAAELGVWAVETDRAGWPSAGGCCGGLSIREWQPRQEGKQGAAWRAQLRPGEEAAAAMGWGRILAPGSSDPQILGPWDGSPRMELFTR